MVSSADPETRDKPVVIYVLPTGYYLGSCAISRWLGHSGTASMLVLLTAGCTRTWKSKSIARNAASYDQLAVSVPTAAGGVDQMSSPTMLSTYCCQAPSSATVMAHRQKGRSLSSMRRQITRSTPAGRAVMLVPEHTRTWGSKPGVCVRVLSYPCGLGEHRRPRAAALPRVRTSASRGGVVVVCFKFLEWCVKAVEKGCCRRSLHVRALVNSS